MEAERAAPSAEAPHRAASAVTSPQPFSSTTQSRRIRLLGTLLPIFSLGGLFTHLLIIHSLTEIYFYPGDGDGGNR